MAQAIQGPLDETVFSDPGWAVRNGWGCLHINSILHYFGSSPFMDPTSNNRVLMVQAQSNQDTWNRIIDYQRFEATLRGMQGIEYVVTGTPQQLNAQGEDTGIWVIRKQNRRKRPGAQDEVTTLGTYYIVGENIYQAPSVGDVLNHRLLTSTTAFSKFVSLASSLPLFTPATGHTYLPATYKPATKTIDPARSRATTPGLEPPPSSQASISQPVAGKPTPKITATDARTLFDSLALSLRYGHEFMDENPLKGEPGSFHFSATSQAVYEQRLQRERAAQAAAAAAAAAAAQSAPSTQGSQPGSQVQSAVGTPMRDEGRDKPSPGRKGSEGKPKAKRRKSKAPTSPSTPIAA
ncbi:hypothetical protein W97_00748 [Coniosporium apollinis CBS 100218]|uniref:Mediator of RNA polymerase II transcription subunit 6 n=1 Tax=Coniosporium apollinis (strain CBS 100218) TaxID=1168221 RepID=R7YI24_CONA1|nr:uncharacterized protein W97_00748 [Coniosporium apollinis CBS 100218]EON61533.1 hypothetical protein W97_00748 [Coniosporium apollinis CBS 100218]